MSKKLEDYMCKHVQDQTSMLKRYLLAVLDNQDQYIYYLDESLGTPLPSMDIRNCELLTDAKLFREEIKLTRDGRNRYKLFYLTMLGKEIAQQIKKESYTDEMSEPPQVKAHATEQK